MRIKQFKKKIAASNVKIPFAVFCLSCISVIWLDVPTGHTARVPSLILGKEREKTVTFCGPPGPVSFWSASVSYHTPKTCFRIMRHLVTTWCPPGDHLVTASWPRGDHLVATGWPLFHYFSIVKSDSGPMASTAVFKWRPKSLRSKRSTNGRRGRGGGLCQASLDLVLLTLPFQYGSNPSYYKVQLCFNSDFQCIFIFSLVNDFEIH